MSDKIKKYMKIERFGKKGTEETLIPFNSTIVVQEKLDGANTSFALFAGEIAAFSRNNQLDEDNDLRGFYAWTQTLPINELNPKFVYFGEWLVKHNIFYGKEHMNQFYLFDIYDTQSAQYIHFNDVKQEAQRLNIQLVPVFYEGRTVSEEQLNSYVGQSLLGEIGEGIVVKNVNYRYRGQQIYTKFVSPSFSEVKIKQPKITKQSQEQLFIAQFLTQARVEKMLYKLVDEQILPENFDFKALPTILKNANIRLYQDLLEEERDELGEEFDERVLRKALSKKLTSLVRQIILSRSI